MTPRPVLHLVQRPLRTASQQVVPLQLSIASDALLKGSREVLIHHGGEVYRLRHTRNDKLILTK
jgi:hemin uptake protein HemP